MRTIKKTQIELGATPIEDITFDLQSRDHICARRTTGTLHKRCTRLFAILEDVFSPVDCNKERPGMDYIRTGYAEAGSTVLTA